MNNINFANPWLLLLAVPLFAAVLVPFFIAVRRDNANFHNVTAMVINLLICTCVTLALSGLSTETVITETNVYILADVSYSTEHTVDDVQKSLEKVAKKLPPNSKAGVICFGRNYKLVSELGDKIPDIRGVEVDRSATDIGAAMRYAGNIFDEGVIKRIIVITDGAETIASNNIVRVVNQLQEQNVYVDAVYIDDNLPENIRELQIDAIEATSSTYTGKSEQVNVLVRANCPVAADGKESYIEGRVSLYRGDQFIKSRPAAFYNGLTGVAIDLSTDDAGTFDYRVEVAPEDPKNDFSKNNNECFFTQEVTAERRVLFLGGSQADIEAGRKIYGTDGVDYITDGKKVKFTIEELCVYDEIVTSNFDVTTVSPCSVFMDSVSALVERYGKTFTTFGNTFVDKYVEGSTSAENLALEKLKNLLPVDMGDHYSNARLVNIVFDFSLSMHLASRMSTAKKIACAVVDTLNSKDTFMLMGFSGEVAVLLQPTPVRSTAAIKSVINDMPDEGDTNTNISNALKYANQLMSAQRQRDKQVILITDGLNPSSDNAAAVSEAEKLCGNGIAVSAISINNDSAKGFLNSLWLNKNNKDGRGFVKTVNGDANLQVVLDSISETSNEIKLENEKGYNIVMQHTTEQVFDGVGKIDGIGGLYNNKRKPNSTVLLYAEYQADRLNTYQVPVYAYGDGGGGNGKVVTFTGDLCGDWLSGWQGGSGEKFLSNIPTATLPYERIATPLLSKVSGSGSSTKLTVTSMSANMGNLSIKATITDPKNLVTEKELGYADGEYFTTFTTDTPGRYKVNLSYMQNNTPASADHYFSVLYYAEYDSFASYNKSQLYRLISYNGDILNVEDMAALENTDSKYTTYIFDFTLPLMIATAVLFVVGITIRQLKWKDITSFFIRRRRK